MDDQTLKTIRDVREVREQMERDFLQDLQHLCAITGMDLDRVHVLTVVRPGPDDAPQVVPYAVKIVLSA